MGPSNAVVILVILVTASASPTSNQAAQEKAAKTTSESKGASEVTSTTAAPAVTPAAAKANNGPISSHHQQPLHGSLVRKRSGYMEQLYSEPPGAETPYFWAGDRRRSNDRFVRAPVKRSPMRAFIPRNKRESSADDDALALLALWASAANRDDLSKEPLNYNGIYKFASLLNSLKEAYPQHFYGADAGQPYENYELGPQEVAEEPEIVLPEEEAYPRYNTWTDPDYVVPERFTVMRRSPGGLLPILPSYHKRSANLEDVPTNGRWGAFAPQRKRFMVAKRSPVSQGDVYSLAQMLGEDQNEQNVPIYRRLML